MSPVGIDMTDAKHLAGYQAPVRADSRRQAKHRAFLPFLVFLWAAVLLRVFWALALGFEKWEFAKTPTFNAQGTHVAYVVEIFTKRPTELRSEGWEVRETNIETRETKTLVKGDSGTASIAGGSSDDNTFMLGMFGYVGCPGFECYEFHTGKKVPLTESNTKRTRIHEGKEHVFRWKRVPGHHALAWVNEVEEEGRNYEIGRDNGADPYRNILITGEYAPTQSKFVFSRGTSTDEGDIWIADAELKRTVEQPRSWGGKADRWFIEREVNLSDPRVLIDLRNGHNRR